MSDRLPPARPAAPAAEHRIADAADDWPVQATDAIVNLVDAVRDRTTGPVLRAVNGVVIGLAVAMLLPIVGLLLLLAVVRGLHEALDLVVDREVAVYSTYLGLGLVLVVAGLLLWRKRTP